MGLLLLVALLLVAWVFVTGRAGVPTPTGRDAPSTSTSSVVDSRAGGTPAIPRAVSRPSAWPTCLPEASRIVDLIDGGGPFDEDEDGRTFRNDEGILPDQPRGYYREYTVPTPGSDDRGARRIVGGEDGALYWTADHYRSFSRIAE